MNRRELILSTLFFLTWSKHTFSSVNLLKNKIKPIPNNAVLLSTYIKKGLADIEALKTAFADAETLKLLVIDISIVINQVSISDSINIHSGMTIIFTDAGEIIQKKFGIPLFWAVRARNINIISAKIKFDGEIPLSLPMITKQFIDFLFDRFTKKPIPSVESGACLLFWECHNIHIDDALFSASSETMNGFMHQAIGIYHNSDFFVTNAIFDGIIMGVLGSGCTNIIVTGISKRRGNLDQTVRAWSPPGHVVYISPSINVRSSKVKINISENDNEVSDSYEQGASTVSIKDADNCHVSVISSFPQGFLTLAGVSGNFYGEWHGFGSNKKKYAELRILTTGHQSGMSCFNSVLDFKLYRPLSSNYIELGSLLNNKDEHGGIFNSFINIDIITKERRLSLNETLPTMVLVGANNNINLSIDAPNLQDKKIYPLAFRSNAGSNKIKLSLKFPKKLKPLIHNDKFVFSSIVIEN